MDWQQYFDFNAKAGALIWKDRPTHTFRSQRSASIWRARFAGKVAGWKAFQRNGDPLGIMLSFRQHGYLAHRIIWEMSHGAIPQGMQVDHVNRNPFDNRLSNIRLATPSQNSSNKGLYRNNKSGRKGVYWGGHSWIAQIKFKNNRIHLGSFSDIDEAYKAYCEAAKTHHGVFCSTEHLRP